MQGMKAPEEDVVAELARIHAGLTRTIARLRDVNARFATNGSAGSDSVEDDPGAATAAAA
jgi:hypothetical protein